MLQPCAPFVVARKLEIVSRHERRQHGRLRHALGGVERRHRLLIQRAAEQREIRSIGQHGVAAGDLGAHARERRPCHGCARLERNMVYQLVPIFTHSQIESEMLRRLPVVVHVRSCHCVWQPEIAVAFKPGCRSRQTVQADYFEARALERGVVIQALRVSANFKLMLPPEMHLPRKEVRE